MIQRKQFAALYSSSLQLVTCLGNHDRLVQGREHQWGCYTAPAQDHPTHPTQVSVNMFNIPSHGTGE